MVESEIWQNLIATYYKIDSKIGAIHVSILAK